MTVRRALIWGAGGHGSVVADLLRAAGLQVVGFVDSHTDRLGSAGDASGAPILLDDASFRALLRAGERIPEGAAAVALGIGDNAARLQCARALGQYCAPAVAHPRASVSETASLGMGTVVLAGAVVNPGAAIGTAVIINSGAVVEHDCVLGDAVHVSPGAVLTGGVRIDDRAWVGAGAVVIPKLRIGKGAIVGAGAVVLHDVGDNTTVVGNPARRIR